MGWSHTKTPFTANSQEPVASCKLRGEFFPTFLPKPRSEDFIPFKSNKGHIHIYVVFLTSELAELAIARKKIEIPGLKKHIEISKLQDLTRLMSLREARTSHTHATSQLNPGATLLANTTATEPALQPVGQEIAMLRYQYDMIVGQAQAQRDAAQAALAVSQQEFAVRNQQLTEGQSRIKALEDHLQNSARERGERDKQWHARCETIKGDWEERLKNELHATNEDWGLRCTALREEWSTKLRRDLEVANAEWRTRLEMREMELKSEFQNKMETEAHWRAQEQKRLEQELTAARETTRLSNHAAEVEMARRIALEHQLEDIRTRERIQPELMKALLSVDTIARQMSQATSFQHPHESSVPLGLKDFSNSLVNTEEPTDSPITGDPKRRRLR